MAKRLLIIFFLVLVYPLPAFAEEGSTDNSLLAVEIIEETNKVLPVENTPTETTKPPASEEIFVETPPSDEYWIVINKEINRLFLFRGKQVEEVFPCATGANYCTPTSKSRIVTKVVNPTWGGGGYAKPVAGGSPNNPLGYRWMGLSINGTPGNSWGIHGTNAPSSIGKNVSHGCIRMYNEDSFKLFALVPKGTPVWIGMTDELLKLGVDTRGKITLGPQTKPVTVKVNDAELVCDTSPYLQNSRVMIPFRAVFETLQAQVGYSTNENNKINHVWAIAGEKTVELTMGSKIISVNGTSWEMDVAPILKNGRTFIPLRFGAEGLGADVQWDAENNTALIYYN